MFNSTLTREATPSGVWEELGCLPFCPISRYYGLGPSSDSFRETAFSIRGIEPELLQLCQRYFPRKLLNSWLLFV
jgi:hypothetical protein